MADDVPLDPSQHRLLIAMRYLNSSEEIYKGLERQKGTNNFHFLVTLRSFIEYTRRGIWFLAWASDKRIKQAEALTFRESGTPALMKMDEMFNEALGDGRISHLMAILPGINEPFLNCLHALTHGNPIAVKFTVPSLQEKAFNVDGLCARAGIDLDIFRALLYRRMLGEEIDAVWKVLAPIHNMPHALKLNVLDAGLKLQQSGKTGSQPEDKAP